MSAFLRDLGELAAHYAPFAWFPVIWSVSLATVCAGGVVLRGTGRWEAGAGASAPPPRPAPTPAGIAAGAAFAVFLCAYVALVFYHDDLVGQDFNLSIGGRFANVLIWPWAGRFVPLANQEYSVLSLVGTSAPLYHAWSILQLGVLLACVFRLMNPAPAWLRFLALTFLLALASIVYSFFGLVFTERDLVFWLVVWIACSQSWTRTGNRAAFFGAMIAVQCALYYKETAFVIVSGAAGARLLLGAWRSADQLRQKQYARYVRDHALELGALALCAVFLLTYAVAIAPFVTESYAATGGRQGASAAALSYVGSNLLTTTLAVAFGWRLVALARAKQAPDLFWEPLAAGGLLFALAYVVLGITREYYLAPVDVIAVMYLARLGHEVLRGGRRMAMVAAVLLIGLILQRSIPESAFFILTRKEYVQGRVNLERALREYAQARGRSEVTMFFPQAGGFHLMEFAAFLRLKGWRPAHEPAAPSTAPTFVIKSTHKYPDDRCYHSQEYRCLYAPSPQAGDLVVLFPGRLVTAGELGALRSGSREVLHYTPRPGVVERLLSALVDQQRLTDQPSDGYVFER